jgi:hypothetical protein
MNKHTLTALAGSALIASSASAAITGLVVEAGAVVDGRRIFSVFAISNGTNDVMLNVFGHSVIAGNMANVRHSDSFLDDASVAVGHWNASYTSASTAASSNQWRDSYVTITGKTGASSATSLDPSFGTGAGNLIPYDAGWYTANPAVDVVVTNGRIKIMQIALVDGANGYTATLDIGYKLQGTTTALFAMDLQYVITPAPGALALLGSAGFISRRRRR